MTQPVIASERVLQGTNPTLLARAVDHDGNALDQAACTSITYATYDLDDKDTVVDSGSLTVSDVIFDTLQTGSRWTVDSTGYNFAWTVPTSAIPNAGKTYQIEVTIDATDADAGNIILVFLVTIVDALSVADV